MVGDADPVIQDRPEFRAIFVWAVPFQVQRINFGYWGNMLFVQPVVLAESGPTLPEDRIEASAVHRLSPAEGFDRFAKGDTAGYDSALTQLRRLDPDAADRAAALVTAPDATASGRPPAP